MAFANQDDQVEVSDPVSLNALGIVDQASQKCKNVYITQGDYVTQIIYRYNTLGVIQLSVSTAFGTRESFGETVTSVNDSSLTQSYSLQDLMLYGFEARMDPDTGYLVALGAVSYDYICVSDEKLRLGNNFYWERSVATTLTHFLPNFQLPARQVRVPQLPKKWSTSKLKLPTTKHLPLLLLWQL